MKKLLALILIAIFFTPVLAHAEKFEYDPLHSQVLFSINHMGYTNSHGRFNKFTGGFDLDEQHPENTTVDMTIDVNSLDMADDTWNKHVKEKLLDADKYPTMTFKGTKITRTGDKAATLTGDLTMHGVTKPVTLNVVLNNIGTNQMMPGRKDAGFTATGTLKRSDFGMGAFIPMVGDEVTLTIEADGMNSTGEKTGAKGLNK